MLLLFPAMKGQSTLHYFLMGQDSFANSPNLNHDWRPGMVNITEIGYAFGLADTQTPYSKWAFSLTNITGYQFMRNLKAGIGYGIQKHNEGFLIPLFIDTRVNLSGRYLVPFASAAGGVAMSTEDFENESRIFVNPAVGVRYVLRRKMALNFSAGLLIQEGGANRTSFINLRLGVEFKGGRWSF